MNSPARPLYVWDTSALIAAWVERYPPDVLPMLWEKLADAIAAGRMIAPQEVATELEKRSDDLHKFLAPQKPFFVPTDEDVLNDVASILGRFPRLVMERKRAYAADPFVIATARLHGAIVVTEEGRGSIGRPKITDVCDAYSVPCIGLLECIRRQGWKF